jgi:hypothetical protein
VIGRPFTSQNAITAGTWRRGIVHQRGEENNASKLTAYDVRLIRSIKADTALLAHALGVSYNTIQRVRARKTWRHIP